MASKAVFNDGKIDGWHAIGWNEAIPAGSSPPDDEYAGLGQLTVEEKNYLAIVRRAKRQGTDQQTRL